MLESGLNTLVIIWADIFIAMPGYQQSRTKWLRLDPCILAQDDNYYPYAPLIQHCSYIILIISITARNSYNSENSSESNKRKEKAKAETSTGY
jgi:hypothetical protein